MKKTISKIPLISEDYPDDYASYRFISLIQFGKERVLTVIDNTDDAHLQCYVLDLCGPEGIDEKVFLELANVWHLNESSEYPLSIYFARNNVSDMSSKIMRKFPIEFVSRVIGPMPKYSMNGTGPIKRKKRRQVSVEGVTSQFIDY